MSMEIAKVFTLYLTHNRISLFMKIKIDLFRKKGLAKLSLWKNNRTTPDTDVGPYLIYFADWYSSNFNLDLLQEHF